MQTTPENLAKINATFDAMKETLTNLAVRWIDEKDYEDIEEYRVVLAKMLPEGFAILKMTTRPFGFVFTLIGSPNTYAMFCTMRKIGWKRI